MTFLDMIEMYNLKVGNDLDDIESLFEGAQIDERLDKHVLAGVLLDKCGAMNCIYETTATFKYFSDNFFKKYEWNITKLVDSVNLRYDPLKNKSVTWTETTDIAQNLDTDETSDKDRERKNTGTQGSSYTESETNTVSAMNSSNYEPDNKRDTTGSNTRTDNLNEKIDESNTRTKNEDLTWDETDEHIESGMVNGTYQDLIEKERKQAQFNVYNWIADKYAKELFLLVY